MEYPSAMSRGEEVSNEAADEDFLASLERTFILLRLAVHCFMAPPRPSKSQPQGDLRVSGSNTNQESEKLTPQLEHIHGMVAPS